jgi:hypothetical protein
MDENMVQWVFVKLMRFGGDRRGVNKRLARWDGTAWSSVYPFVGQAHALAVDGDRKVYGGGRFTTIGGVAANRVARA